MGFRLKAVNAAFDGTGAASSWMPAVVLISDSNHIIARAVSPGASVAAGASAEVSFFPGAGLAGGPGIQFDTDNEGGWLQVNTNIGGATAVFADQTINNAGAVLTTQDGSILAIGTNGGGDVQIDSSNGTFLEAGSGTGTPCSITMSPTGVVTIQSWQGIGINAGTDLFLQAKQQGASGDIQARLDNGDSFVVIDNGTATIRFQVTPTVVSMPHLPTVNPGVANQVWRNGNVLNIV